MKIIILLITVSLLLCSCATTDIGKLETNDITTVENPFENITSDNQNFSTDEGSDWLDEESEDYMELFGKYQVGGFFFGNWLPQESQIEYNGGKIEISFSSDSTGNEFDVEEGYVAFLNGIPQLISINGGEETELVCRSQMPDTVDTVTLSVTPRITKDLIDETNLTLTILSIFQPSFKPEGQYVGFGNAHRGNFHIALDLIVNSPLEVIDESEKAFTEYESILITDTVKEEYDLGDNYHTNNKMIYIQEPSTNRFVLPIKEGSDTIQANLLMFGPETGDYKVYLYKKHQHIQISGYDYINMEVKTGCLSMVTLNLENIQDRDFLYAIAISTDFKNVYGIYKSSSVLIVQED